MSPLMESLMIARIAAAVNGIAALVLLGALYQRPSKKRQPLAHSPFCEKDSDPATCGCKWPDASSFCIEKSPDSHFGFCQESGDPATCPCNGPFVRVDPEATS